MNLEFNKIFAALLVAGITATGASFASKQIMHPHDLEHNAVPIEVTDVVAGGAKKVEKTIDPISHLIATADIERGKKLSKACAACHSFEKGGPNRVGPNLWGVIGGKKAHMDSFSYSAALTEMGGTWGYEDFNKFIYKPKKFISGTKMNYAGLKKPADRAALAAWLATMSDSPLPPPAVVAVTPSQSTEESVEAVESIKEEIQEH